MTTSSPSYSSTSPACLGLCPFPPPGSRTSAGCWCAGERGQSDLERRELPWPGQCSLQQHPVPEENMESISSWALEVHVGALGTGMRKSPGSGPSVDWTPFLDQLLDLFPHDLFAFPHSFLSLQSRLPEAHGQSPRAC